MKLTVTISIDEHSVHISQPGKSGTSFDTGENGEDLAQAILDLSRELLARYRALNDVKKPLDNMFGFNQ